MKLLNHLHQGDGLKVYPNIRNVSAEIFVVCKGYKAPQKIDPKFLDPRSVFEELPEPSVNAEAKVFHPEKRKRQREGYEDGDYTFYREITAMKFVETQDPIQILSTVTKITWSDEASRKLRFKDITTKEILACTEDLKVLGRKEFRNLLKWRLTIREELGLVAKKEEKAAEPSELVHVTEDDQIDAEMSQLAAQDQATRKRERRKLNERKQREITRMQMGMLTPHELGLERDVMAQDDIFALKRAEQNGAMLELLKGAVPLEEDDEQKEDAEDVEIDSEEEVDDLEMSLDTMYVTAYLISNNRYKQYQERKSETNAKYRAKRFREEIAEWDGIGETNGEIQQAEAFNSESDEEFDGDSDRELDNPVDSLLTSLGPRLDAQSKGQLSRRAALFFSQPEFEGLEVEPTSENAITNYPPEADPQMCLIEEQEDDGEEENEVDEGRASESELSFEIVPSKDPKPDSWADDSEDEKSHQRPSMYLPCHH